ncbi:hypothetical protein FHS11_001060 [Mucilaginibacter gotjawali]|uniref:Uncharacterized protein n=1 Tax=Mucilaginibacter gotjawali TaxID=1550579 RepID=A0A839SCL6_9SPHI|nr:hypothetical protein [Mucilaginibacter gotjawali]
MAYTQTDFFGYLPYFNYPYPVQSGRHNSLRDINGTHII